MNGLSVTILVACFCILIAGLFAVIVERTNERDAARAEAERRGRERDAAEQEARIASELVDQLRADLRAARPLHAVPVQREPLVVADDRWWESLYDEKGGRRG